MKIELNKQDKKLIKAYMGGYRFDPENALDWKEFLVHVSAWAIDIGYYFTQTDDLFVKFSSSIEATFPDLYDKMTNYDKQSGQIPKTMSCLDDCMTNFYKVGEEAEKNFIQAWMLFFKNASDDIIKEITGITTDLTGKDIEGFLSKIVLYECYAYENEKAFENLIDTLKTELIGNPE